MQFKKVIMVSALGLLFATSAWGQPADWAVWVPTHAQYIQSGSGPDAFYSDYVNDHFFGSLWNLTGINQVSWGCCCAGDPGHLMTCDSTAIEQDSLVGDYYDCNGNLLQSNAARFGAWVVRDTGPILTGGIGSQWTPCYLIWGFPSRRMSCLRRYVDPEEIPHLLQYLA